MTFFIYAILFIVGTLIGSFCTLAVYRLPLGKDITHERSFCPKCNHRLNFIDLIPVFSYIFLGGKCRYCREKIRPRYLVLEVCAGITMLVLGVSFNFNFLNMELDKIIALSFSILYIAGLTIIAGIDKENKKIQKSVLIFNVIITLIYMIYLFVVGNTNVNRYVIYSLFMFALLLIYFIDLKKQRQRPFAFYISIINIALIIVQNFILYYII